MQAAYRQRACTYCTKGNIYQALTQLLRAARYEKARSPGSGSNTAPTPSEDGLRRIDDPSGSAK